MSLRHAGARAWSAVVRVLAAVGGGIRRVIGWVLVGLIRGYQLAISPLLGPRCRFHPTCSAYALTSVRRHGPGKGLLLAGWRLLRCNPWNAGGLDPVPARGAWKPDIHPDGRPRDPVPTST